MTEQRDSLFDPPEADKCLLAFGEFKVGRSMFDVQYVSVSQVASWLLVLSVKMCYPVELISED